jgi:hypothetical protein
VCAVAPQTLIRFPCSLATASGSNRPPDSMRLRYLAVFAFVFLSASACDDSRRVSGKMEIQISGAFEKSISGQANAGYSATVSGGGYSFGISWPEDSATVQESPMSARNTTPMFFWHSPQQPTEGLHTVTTLERGVDRPGSIYALMEGPHDGTDWSSDSGTVSIVKSRDRSLALAGTFDIWLSCTQECPCKDKPCQVRVRGSMMAP